jgi:DNA (cytosine-5)-methyltransferase 1
MLTIGSLFSGIGGIELGLERTGNFRTIWVCENDGYANAVLKKHWPDVPNLGDITEIKWEEIEKPDLICGGFPCQDISVAGKGKGIKHGKRSGLWKEYANAISVLRPKYALIENVPMLAKRGLDIVLSDLAEIRYDAEWFCLSAADVGAWHRRERIFIISYPCEFGCMEFEGQQKKVQQPEKQGIQRKESGQSIMPESLYGNQNVPNSDSSGYIHRQAEIQPTETRKYAQRESLPGSPYVPHTQSLGIQGLRPGGEQITFPYAIKEVSMRHRQRNRETIWATEPGMGRVVNGVPNRMDRIKCLGNAVVPQVAEAVGEMIAKRF